MSRQELAEAVNAYLWREHQHQSRLDANYVGKLERGDHRWPTDLHREAFRVVLGAEIDADLGFHIIRSPRQRPSSSTDRAVTHTDAVLEAPWEIAHRRGGSRASNVDEARLSYLEQATAQAIGASESRPPAVLAPLVRSLHRYVHELMCGNQHPPQRARLYVVGTYLSGVLGALALDLGHRHAATEYGAEAYDLADAADQPDLRAWTRATQSLIAYYHGSHHDALALARDGQRWAHGTPHGVRLAINGEARALAKLGDAYGVDEAVDRAFSLLAAVPTTPDVSASLTTDSYCGTRTAANAATAYLAIGVPKKVIEHGTHALTAFDKSGLHGPQALSRLDLATAALMGDDPQPELACGLVADALTVSGDEQFESVRQRAAEFLHAAKPWATTPAVRRVTELVQTRTIRPALDS